jgi:hypothetical protein
MPVGDGVRIYKDIEHCEGLVQVCSMHSQVIFEACNTSIACQSCQRYLWRLCAERRTNCSSKSQAMSNVQHSIAKEILEPVDVIEAVCEDDIRGWAKSKIFLTYRSR